MGQIALIAAIERELCDVDGARNFCCGIGPLEAGLATMDALTSGSYDAVLNVGTAGARSLSPGTIVIGTESVYSDVLDPNATAPRIARLDPDHRLLSLLRTTLPEAAPLPIATTGRVGGAAGFDVEAMEGFGVMRAARLAGVAAAELRVISNSPAQTDRRLWHLDDAFAALHHAIRTIVPAVARGLR